MPQVAGLEDSGMVLESTLENGVSCCFVRTQAPTTTICLTVGEGSLQDSVQQSGETHLLEHLFFAPRSNTVGHASIGKRIERLGGIFNAHVRKEYSLYWIDCLPDRVPEALTLLTELIATTDWSRETILSEYDLMQEEYAAYQTDYALVLSDHCESQAICGPLHRSLFSEFQGLSTLTPARFAERHEMHWRTAPLRAQLVGALPEGVIDFAQRTLGTITRASVTKSLQSSRWKTPLPKSITVPQTNMQPQESYLAWLLPFNCLPPEVDSLISYLIGKNSASRILEACRAVGVGYNFGSHVVPYRDLSYLYISTSIPASKENLCRETVESALRSYAREPISIEEFAVAQTMLHADMIRELCSASAIADSIAHEIEIGSTCIFPYDQLWAVRNQKYEVVRDSVSLLTSSDYLHGVLRS